MIAAISVELENVRTAWAGAQTHVDEILTFGQHSLDGVLEPFGVYLTCYHVLSANDDPRATSVLQTAYKQLQERAFKITRRALRQSCLENVSVHLTSIKKQLVRHSIGYLEKLARVTEFCKQYLVMIRKDGRKSLTNVVKCLMGQTCHLSGQIVPNLAQDSFLIEKV